jgi:predicted nucleotidyltransferase
MRATFCNGWSSAEQPMLDRAEHQLTVLRCLPDRRVPGCEVRAFGSRVPGNARRHSDLYLVIMVERPLPAIILAELRAEIRAHSKPIL